jgi:hypothetical protein
MAKEFTVHGVNYIRTGQCNRCGACEKDTCPHYSFTDGLATCAIQSRKNDVCEKCSNDPEAYAYDPKTPVDHKICAVFPNHPFLRVIQSGICGYKFEPATDEDKKKHRILVEAWE